MTKQVLVTGASGQLGQSLQTIVENYPSLSFFFAKRKDLDLTNTSAIKGILDSLDLDVIINCGAYTAVDQAETDETTADQINHRAVNTLAQMAKEKNITLIHISTDYVFNGESYKPYREKDSTSPQNIYGKTKLAGELAFIAHNPTGCIIRTSWLYSEFGNNFVKTMLKLGKEKEQLNVIFDQIGTPTYARDLAKTILDIIASDKKSQTLAKLKPNNKIFHFSNDGVCSWYDFANAIFEYAEIDCSVYPIETKDYPTPAKRPHYSVMNKSAIKSHLKTDIPYWKNSLYNCLQNLRKTKQ